MTTEGVKRDALLALEKRVAEVLKPFADELDGAFGGLALDHEPITNFEGVNIRVGDLRKAAALLRSLTKGDSP